MTTLVRPARTGRRPLLFAAEGPPLPRVRLGGMAAVGIGGYARAGPRPRHGRLAHPADHLGYGPIILAAYLFGWRGALATAAYVGILIGLVPAATGMVGGVEQPNAWAIRGVMFIAVGVLIGALFDRSRAALHGVQMAAVEIAQHQRDGMVAQGASS